MIFSLARPKVVRSNIVQSAANQQAEVVVDTGDDTPANTQRKPKKTRRSFDSMIEDCEATPLSEAQVLSFTPAQIMKLATGSKDDALSLQVFAETCSQAAADHLASCIAHHLGEMAGHPTGNFVVQKLIRGSSNFSNIVAAHCRADFINLAANEFSSRVMQCLVGALPQGPGDFHPNFCRCFPRLSRR
jgi:hypothetical protein